MILLKSKWQAGSNEFIDFLKLVDAFKVNDKDSMYIDQNYIKNFNYGFSDC